MKDRNKIYSAAFIIAVIAIFFATVSGIYAETNPIKDYRFIHSRGIIDNWEAMYNADKTNRNWNEYNDWCDWTKWDTNGQWKDEVNNPSKYSITMPSFAWITNATDPVRIPEVYGAAHYAAAYAPGSAVDVRQTAHVTDHQVYCSPTGKIYLYPYSEYGQRMMTAYCDSLNRWYDYSTDLKSPNLTFLSDYTPLETAFGHLGGSQPQKFYPTKIHYIKSVEEYVEFARAIAEEGKYTDDTFFLNCDLNFQGVTAKIYPFGTYNHPFTGTFDGNGHKVTNLTVQCTAAEYNLKDNHLDANGYIGMFGRVDGDASIRNLHIAKSCSFKGYDVVGFIGGIMNNDGQEVLIENIFFEGTVVANNGKAAGGILGSNVVNKPVCINNCLVSGDIWSYYSEGDVSRIPPGSGAFIGWSPNAWKYIKINYCLNANSNLTISGKYTSSNVTSITNCFSLRSGDPDATALPKVDDITISVKSKEMRDALGSRNWIFNDDASWAYDYPIPTIKAVSHLPGAVATFAYTPEDQVGADGYYPDKYIALDISQTFDNEVNIKQETQTITEPMVAFRHIFKVSDGRRLADKYSMSKENNDAYIDSTRHTVSARAGDMFQIRLDFPIPTAPDNSTSYTSVSNRYYFAGNNTYKQFSRCNIETTKLVSIVDNARTTLYTPDSKGDYICTDAANGIYEYRKWTADDTFSGQRYTMGSPMPANFFHEAEKYTAQDGCFARMLRCDNPEAGVYLVKVFAAEKTGQPVKIFNTGDPLQVSEFLVTFLPANEASFITEKEYDAITDKSDLYTHTESYLKKFCSDHEPIVIDFDEYALLETLDPKDGYVSNDYIKTAKNISVKPEVTELNLTAGDHYRIYTGNGNMEAEILTVGTDKKITGKNYFNVEAKSVTDPVSGQSMPSRYFKWPVPRKYSSYGYGYADRMEYNMYSLANHSFATIYHGATTLQSSYHDITLKKVDATGEPVKDDDGKDITVKVYENSAINTSNLYRRDNWVGGDGLYDRLFYNSGGQQQGYFYYLNAASDPGVIREIEMDEPCDGTILHVSAWLAEFSRAEETANLIINFQAVMDAEGTETVKLHSFVSGYVDPDDCGNWMHIYYSFVYNKASLKGRKPHHFQVTLENNAANSKGADYAVDDIRIYITHPNVSARQTKAFCKRDITANVEIGIDFETLLATVGVDFADLKPDETRTIYYAFIDHDDYRKYMDGKLPLEDAFLVYKYNGEDAQATYYGTQTFHTRFEQNPASNRGIWGAGRDTFIFDAYPQDNNMVVGKKYYVVMYLPLKGEDTGSADYTDFIINPDNPFDCAKYGVFTVEPSAVININGVAMASASDIYVCPNQKPDVTVSLQDPTDTSKVQKKVYVDWYEGSLNDFMNETTEPRKVSGSDEDVTVSLETALNRFRMVYPTGGAEDVEVKDTPIDILSESVLTKEMIALVRRLAVDEKKLHLYRNEFPFVHYTRNVDAKMVIIPIDEIGVPETPDGYEGQTPIYFNVCMDPIEITIHYQEPSLNHGFSQIDYPEGLDVPVRLGLSQIDEVSVNAASTVGANTPCLAIPLRDVHPVTEGITQLKKFQYGEKFPAPKKDVKENDYWFDYDPEIVLISTNDPLFSNDAESSEDGVFTLRSEVRVGEVLDFEAQYSGDSADDKIKDSGNEIYVFFYNKFQKLDAEGNVVEDASSLKFREGYEYTLQFKFAEYRADGSTLSASGEDTKLPPCGGFHNFSIRIVADYQKWIGQEMPNVNNWNNDENWKRVDSDELALKGDWKATADASKNKSDFVTDGNNGNTFSYAPLDFTKVIIPGLTYGEGGERLNSVPELYESESETQKLYKGLQVSRTIMWYRNPAPDDNLGVSPYTEEEEVQYDMVARVLKNAADNTVSGLQCVPWYMNTCKEIHFRPGSEIGRQRMLKYERAWVDVELANDKWYTLSSPLQEVIAGDWYLPTNGARENSTLFEDITFNETSNHRFKPAVYQRAWNRAETKIFEFGQANYENGIDKLLKSSWSHVYNDVEEKNGIAGTGFSIKADGASADNWNAGISEEDAAYDKVLFRLPKADTAYDYYQHGYGDADAPDNNSGHHTDIGARNNRHRLQAYEPDADNKPTTRISCEAYGAIHEGGESSEYFLVGNPFMAHLDMAEFLNANSAVIEPQFWIMDGDSQNAAVMTGAGLVAWKEDKANNPFLANGNEKECRYVAPMQGFFVKATAFDSSSTARKINLVFDETWTKVNLDNSSSKLKVRTRGADASTLRVSAIANGKVESEAVVGISEDSSPLFKAGEDVEIFDDESQKSKAKVFSFAGDMASIINLMPEWSTTEIAMIAPETKTVTLRFEGSGEFDQLYLYDALENSLTSIFDGLEYEVKGNVKSRLYVTAGMELTDLSESVTISNIGEKVIVDAPVGCPGLNVVVTDMAGRLIRSLSSADHQMEFSLSAGVYAVKAVAGDLSATSKIMIK